MLQMRLRSWPVSVRILLSLFLAIVGGGYLLAVANIYLSHHASDGRPGLTTDDLKAVYSGLEVERSADQALPSRMQEMIDTKMREFLKTDAEYDGLRAWLVSGARQEGFQQAAPPADRSPHDILSENCLRCHNPDGEKGEDKAHRSPFGPDIFTVDYAMVARYSTAQVEPGSTRVKIGPQSLERLVLIGHVHMLSIPVFALITSLLTAMTGLRPAIRGPLVCGPMLILAVDFAGWWLARKWGWTIWLIAGSGGLFGFLFGLQILAVFGSLWFGRRDRLDPRAM